MSPITVLTVCSTNGFLDLFSSCPVATAKGLSLTYGKPKDSRNANSLVDTYPGKQSASLMKEFCNFSNLVMILSETVIVETSPYLEISFTHRFAILFVGQHSYTMVFLLAAF